MEARGFFERGAELTVAPRVRVGVGFGRDRVVGATALVDTGSDVCAFPESMFPWGVPERGEPSVWIEFANGEGFSATLRYPSITVGEIREVRVATVVLPDTPPILGRSFLNRCAIKIEAARDLVHLRRIAGARESG